MEKCTFCVQRTREGRYPACVEVCPVGARKFGNLLDPESEIRRVMETKRVFIFKEDLATRTRTSTTSMRHVGGAAAHDRNPRFLRGCVRLVSRGNRAYLRGSACSASPSSSAALYAHQSRTGLIATNMRDQVSWAFYVGNFTFLVGVAAAAVLLVIPAYVYNWGPIKEVVILGELLAISAHHHVPALHPGGHGAARIGSSTSCRSSGRPTSRARC